MTAKSAIPSVWNAVYALLNVPAITSTLGCAVYDHVPQAPTFPYARLQSPTENRLDTMAKAGKTLTLQVHVFTSSDNYEGGGKAQAIVSKVSELLNYPVIDLTASGFDCLFCRPEDAFDAGDDDLNGVIVKHYVQTIRVEVMER